MKEFPVCPDCGMTTWYDSRCWNRLCESYQPPPPPPPIPESVVVMADSRGAATAPLDDFLAAYTSDSNWWWRVDSGHLQNLFDAAIERMTKAEAALVEITFGRVLLAAGRPKTPDDDKET